MTDQPRSVARCGYWVVVCLNIANGSLGCSVDLGQTVGAPPGPRPVFSRIGVGIRFDLPAEQDPDLVL